MRDQGLSSRRRPRMEQLETRNLLAGNVTVEVTDGGRLLISGDELSNAISIEAGVNDGEYVITGSPTDDGDTTVNDQASYTATGVTRGIRVRMGDGDDTVDASGIAVHGKLAVGMGEGNDTLNLNDVRVARTMRAALGSGDDSASLTNVAVRGRAAVAAAEGNDTVTVSESEFNRRLAIAGGSENDTITVENSNARALAIAARAGDNTIAVNDTNVRRNVSIATGEGNDQISSVNTLPVVDDAQDDADEDADRWGGARISDRGGDNSVSLSNLTVGRGGLRLRSGDGVDTVALDHVRVRGGAYINTGGEADNVEIVDAVFGRGLRVKMLDGDDELRIALSTVHGRTILRGGAGEDTFFDEANEFLGPFAENFELPV